MINDKLIFFIGIVLLSMSQWSFSEEIWGINISFTPWIAGVFMVGHSLGLFKRSGRSRSSEKSMAGSLND